MENIFSIKILPTVIILIFKIIYATVIKLKCNCEDKKIRNLFVFLSFPCPIITGILCATLYKKSVKDNIIIIITLIFSLASILTVSIFSAYNEREKYYDRDGTAHIYASDVVFTDTDNNKYTFNFVKSGYSLLYINSTDKYLDADYCYINSEGYLHYDDDMSITATDEDYCVDTDGSIYYPSKYTSFNKDGTINCRFSSTNLKYDRFGNAYIHDNIPYFDADGNKYFYSFDSDTQKGLYTNTSTGEVFENEYSYVDENGYFVYDEKHNFIKQENVDNVRTYKDSSGKIYYWASGVSWDKDAQLLDSYGEIIK